MSLVVSNLTQTNVNDIKISALVKHYFVVD